MNTAFRCSGRVLTAMLVLAFAASGLASSLPANWRELEHDEFVGMIAGQERQAAFDTWQFDDAERAVLAEHIWTQHLSDEEYLAKHGSFALIMLAKAAAPMLDQEQRAAVEEQLRKIADNPEFMNTLDTRRQWRLWAVMRELGESDEATARQAVNWVVESDAWHEDSAPRFNDNLNMLHTIRQHADVREARDKIIERARQHMRDDPAWLEPASPPVTGRMLTLLVGQELTPEQQESLRPYLVQRLVEDREVFLNLTVVRAWDLWQTAAVLGVDDETRVAWVNDWVASSDRWQTDNARDRNTLATLLRVAGRVGEVSQARTHVINYLAQRPEHDDEWLAGLTAEDLRVIAVNYRHHLSVDQRERLAKAVARRVNMGPELQGSYWDFFRIGELFTTAELRRLVEDEIEAPDGSARLDAGRIAAMSHRRSDSIHAWRDALAERLQQPGLTPDQRATWLLVRSYAGYEFPTDRSGLNWLDLAQEALASAEDKMIRFAAVEWLVRQGEAAREPEQALSVLASLKGQFESPAVIERLEALEGHMLMVREHTEGRRTRAVHAREQRLLEGRLRNLQSRRERAVEMDRSHDTIAAFDQQIAALEQQILEMFEDITE